MRVLQLITGLGVGGAETMLRNLITQFDRTRLETLVISLTTKAPIGNELLALGVPVIALGGRGGVLTPRQILALRHTAAAWNPDVIHSWMYHANLVAQGLGFLWQGRRPALITSVRGALNAPDQQKRALRVVRRLDGLLSRCADAVVFNSTTSAQQHVGIGYDSRRIRVIPNGFDTIRLSPSDSVRAETRRALGFDSEPLVGLVARLDPLKGHRLFLQAAQRVVATRPRCRFLLVGRGCDTSNVQLASWIREFALEAHVTLLGERRDMPAIDCSLDIVVSASLSESFPNAIGEAMACAVPAVVTDVGDCAALVGDTGIVVAPRDATALASGIMQLLNLEDPVRRELGRRARARIVARYSLPSIAGQFAELYEALAVSAGRRPK